MGMSFSAQDLVDTPAAGAAVESIVKTEPAMRLEGLWKTYTGGAQPAVKDLSLDVHDGEIVTLLGPSGCGKTTTLCMVAGLENPDNGNIFFGDRAVVMTAGQIFIPPDKRNVGMVFQSYAFWPHMTVEENVMSRLSRVDFYGGKSGSARTGR